MASDFPSVDVRHPETDARASIASVRHLYVHIPFCPKVCPYCSFYKEASDHNKTRAFLDAVLTEFERRLDGAILLPQTIFFGGGTPSALSTSQLEYLLTGLLRRMCLPGVPEWTLEMNPATVSLEKARLLLDLGVNRISMGVQSWDPGLLEILGRVHSAEQAVRSFEILREAGVPRINLDLIFGVPTQTEGQWVESLRRTLALDPGHISTYCLTYEEDTVFFEKFRRGDFLQDEEADARLFERTSELLEAGGYRQYEISNYARPGLECSHNMAYWQGGDYLGLGPSAFSTVAAERWQNVPDTAEYIRRITANEDPASFRESLNAETRRAERIAFSLRTSHGVSARDLDGCRDVVEAHVAGGLLEESDGRIRLTRRGRLFADGIAAELV